MRIGGEFGNNDGMLTTEEELQQFSEKFAVEPHLIKAYKAALEQGGAQNKSVK